MANQKPTWARIQKPLLGVLFAGFIFIFIYNFFIAEDEPRRKPASQSNANTRPSATTQRSTVPVQTSRQVDAAASKSSTQREALEQELANLTPLDLSVFNVASPTTTPRGNIFAYYVEPPKPPPPPPPPPPISLQYVQPQSVIATTPKAFTLTVTGQGYPDDAQIIMNGRVRETKRVNQTTLSTEVQPGDYMSPGSISIEVRSKSDPNKWYSNQQALSVQNPPDPPFKYYGETGGNALLEVGGVFAHKGYRRGDTIQGVWRIDSITKDVIEVTHLQLNIRKAVSRQEKPR
ncbi:MAG TPA: hypothetical protein VF131_00995 [Blastocatellia bacterium]|nr:hypothetical protein [Blastocatellia bacterium]